MSKSKKKKKDKNLIEISRKDWYAMQNIEVVCNHSRINYFTKYCDICGMSLAEIEKKKEEK